MKPSSSNARSLFARALRTLVIAAMVVAMVPLGVQVAEAQEVPAERFVDPVHGDDANTGLVEEPWRTITHALRASGAADTINVAPGTYNTASGEAFPLVLRDSRKLVAHGYEPSAIIEGAPDLGILTIDAIKTGCEVSGFAFTGGTTQAAVLVNLAGASGQPLWMSGNRFSNNATGALRLVGTPAATGYVPFIYSNEFSNNGGGSPALQGAGISIEAGCGADIIGNTFTSNQAGRGGAIAVTNSGGQNITIFCNRFMTNAGTGAWGGGAMYVQPSQRCALVIEENTFEANTCQTGGAIALLGADAAFKRNTAIDNRSGDIGGFATLGNAVVTAENNWFSGNSADNQGGVWYVHADSSLVERHDTVTDGVGSASAVDAHNDGFLSITSSIYWNPVLARDIRNADSLSYSCVFDPEVADPINGNTIGNGMIYQDPLFDTLDGPPKLAKTSPCIDAGNVWGDGYPSVDLYLTPRPQDGDGNGSAIPDIGCFELQNTPPVATDDSYTTSEDVAVVVAAPGVLGNDTDADADPLTAIKLSDPAHGTVSLAANGSFTYTPSPNWYGTDSFTYSAADGRGAPGTATITITVSSVDDPIPVPPPVPVPVYRFYNFTNNTHFFTDSAAERDHVIATWPGVYRYEGEAYRINPANNTTSLTRLYNRVVKCHFYTANAAEAADAVARWPETFSMDGPTYAVNPGPVPNSTPVYRFYNLQNGSHFYTSSEEEKNNVVALYPGVYRLEGPAFWIGQ